jgi:fatty-acyl-CoA synthase
LHLEHGAASPAAASERASGPTEPRSAGSRPAERPAAEPATTGAAAVWSRGDDTGCGLLFEGRAWSWSEVVAEMARWGSWLRSLTGTGPPHIGVLLDNVPEFLFALGGALVTGSVAVGLNTTRRGAELALDATHTDCRVILTDAGHRSLLEGLDLDGARVIELGDMPDEAPTAPEHRGPPAPDDLALLLFTAGSTGLPKAVRVTQGRVGRSATGAGFGPDDTIYCAMPLFHGNALFSSVFPALGSGATIALRRKFSASACMADIRSTSSTFFATVGRALSFIVGTPPDPADRDHRLRLVLAPESSMTDVDAFEQRFGCKVLSGYGSSENAIVFVPSGGIPPDALGKPLDGLDVAIVDTGTGRECEAARFDSAGRMLNAADAIGEIVGRSALGRFEGYYDNPEATRQRSRNGWYWSGDLGYRDESGVFYFAGRTLDWLRVDGENFAAAPVERLFGRYGGATGVSVFGVPDERTADDQVMAVLEVPDPSGFDPAGFDEFLACQPDLGTKWAPRYVRVVDRLPVTATNKVDKQALRQHGWRGSGRMFWRPDRGQPLRAMTVEDATALEAAAGAHRRPGGERAR